MNGNEVNPIVELSAVELDHVASQVLATDVAATRLLSAQKIGRSGGGATVGIFYVCGLAQTAAGEQSWSAVAKVLGQPEHPRPGLVANAAGEVAIYRSGVFAELCGGVRSARCYAIQEQRGLQILWLEDLSAAPQAPWIPQYYVETARHFGQFNAHWPETALPTWEWLNQHTFQQAFGGEPLPALFDRVIAHRDDALWSQAFPPDVVEGLERFWKEKNALFAKLEHSPKGVCHADCHPKNLFPMRNTSGQTFTIAIDWERAGIGSLGLDIGHLISSPMSWLELSREQADELIDPVFAAYLAGLREAGWAGNEEQVRLTYFTRVACETFRKMQMSPSLLDGSDWGKTIAQFLRHSKEEILAEWAEQHRFLRRYADEALALARKF